MRNPSTRLGAAALLACAIVPPAIAQPAPAAAQPARWHLDGSTDRCVLSRRLEGTPLAATFILRTIPGSGRYDVILASPDLPADIRRAGGGTSLSFAPVAGAYRGAPSQVDLPGPLGRGIAIGPLPAAAAAAFAGATRLRLDDDGRELGSWAMPAAARAAEALAYCEAEKQVEWGADPAGFEPGATRPRPATDDRAWLTTRDLGLSHALTSVAFTAVFRLVLGADGRPTACTLVESAGNVDLEDACRAVSRRARYEPARDARGNAIRSVAIHVVSFRIENTIRIVG